MVIKQIKKAIFNNFCFTIANFISFFYQSQKNDCVFLQMSMVVLQLMK